MKALKWLVIVIVVLIVGAIGVGFVLPDTASLQRSIVVNAKPRTVFTVLNGFRQFNKWSPWMKYDPNAKITIEGPEFGVGAKQSWAGDEASVGSGSQEIVTSVPFERIEMKLVFAGFDSDNLATYTLKPLGEGTEIVWGYQTHAKGDLLGRYFNLMLDRMLGKDYENGLASLKAFVETLPSVDIAGLQSEVLSVQGQPIVFMSIAGVATEIAPLMTQAYAKLNDFLAANDLKSSQAPIAITHEFDEETMFWKFDAALLVDGQPPAPLADAGIQVGNSYSGLVIRATHVGPYSSSQATYEKLLAFRDIAGFVDNGDSWESYVSDPGTTPEAELVTHIYWPVK